MYQTDRQTDRHMSDTQTSCDWTTPALASSCDWTTPALASCICTTQDREKLDNNTHTPTHTHIYTHTNTHTHTHKLTYTDTLSLTHKHTHTHSPPEESTDPRLDLLPIKPLPSCSSPDKLIQSLSLQTAA